MISQNDTAVQCVDFMHGMWTNCFKYLNVLEHFFLLFSNSFLINVKKICNS